MEVPYKPEKHHDWLLSDSLELREVGHNLDMRFQVWQTTHKYTCCFIYIDSFLPGYSYFNNTYFQLYCLIIIYYKAVSNSSAITQSFSCTVAIRSTHYTHYWQLFWDLYISNCSHHETLSNWSQESWDINSISDCPWLRLKLNTSDYHPTTLPPDHKSTPCKVMVGVFIPEWREP